MGLDSQQTAEWTTRSPDGEKKVGRCTMLQRNLQVSKVASACRLYFAAREEPGANHST